jgi:hypothetical protein
MRNNLYNESWDDGIVYLICHYAADSLQPFAGVS